MTAEARRGQEAAGASADRTGHRAAVIGSPVAHSLSPVLHRAAYADLGLSTWSYTARLLAPDQLADLLAQVAAPARGGPVWEGLSVTMPHKQAVTGLLDAVDPLARAVGAVNTVVAQRHGGGRALLTGVNTDVAGIVGALREVLAHQGTVPGPRAVVLGSGATASSALAALTELGATNVLVAARRHAGPGRAAAAAHRMGLGIRTLTWSPGDPASDAAVAHELAAADLVVSTLPAHAADTITAADQPYYAYYHLDQARAKGYTGQGVTIALLDGEVDTTAPELTGATITDKTPCTVTSSLRSKSHGTALASILVSPTYGVAPDATLVVYKLSAPSAGDTSSEDCNDKKSKKDGPASLINHAINDGAQIITNAHGTTSRDIGLKWAMARAMSEGVIITDAIGNEARDETASSLSWWSGVVGVSSIDTSGKRADYSSWGNGVTTAAVGGPFTYRNYEDGQLIQTSGTSVSAPLVAGFLALARQKWPDATANQLLQALIHTGLSDQSGWNKYTGYGAADAGGLVNTDPSQYPDENPLADKGGGSSPTPEEVQQYTNGLVVPTEIVYDDSYVYRGLDESFLSNSDITYPMHIGTSPRYHGK